MIHRRALLTAIPAMVAGAAFADEVAPALAAQERAIGGRIGLYAENVKSGAKIAWRAGERFTMCSTFKLSLAACILARVDRGKDALGRMVTYGRADILDYAPIAKANLARGRMSVGELCEAVVELSDNTCANLLLARIGGPAALTAFWRATGDTVTRLDHNEPMLNRIRPPDPRDTTAPAAMAGNLRRFVLGDVLSPASRALLIHWMRGCKTSADMLRTGLPAGWTVGDKTGSNGADILGDIAVAWPDPDQPILICVYTEGGRAGQPELHRRFAEIGRLIGRQFT
ncbi:MAG TPA: class A beta-lactamase [Rhizomicrobium sp.]|jgi:beta-lactamase class A